MIFPKYSDAPWSAVTCHRFGRADLSARNKPAEGGVTSPAVKSGDKSPHSITPRSICTPFCETQ